MHGNAPNPGTENADLFWPAALNSWGPSTTSGAEWNSTFYESYVLLNHEWQAFGNATMGGTSSHFINAAAPANSFRLTDPAEHTAFASQGRRNQLGGQLAGRAPRHGSTV